MSPAPAFTNPLALRARTRLPLDGRVHFPRLFAAAAPDDRPLLPGFVPTLARSPTDKESSRRTCSVWCRRLGQWYRMRASSDRPLAQLASPHSLAIPDCGGPSRCARPCALQTWRGPRIRYDHPRQTWGTAGGEAGEGTGRMR